MRSVLPKAVWRAIRRWSLPARRASSRPSSAKVESRRGLPAAGRRLRRKLCRVRRRQHPRHLQGDAADGDGADLWRQGAGGEGRPHRRPVRQAALGRDRGHGRHRAAQLPRRHHQRLRFHPEAPHARPRADAAGLPAVGGHAEPVARLLDRRLCRCAQGPCLDAGLHRRARGREIPRPGQPHQRHARFHGSRRHPRRGGACAADGRVLHQPRGAAAGIRRGAVPARSHVRQMACRVGPHDLDRRPHAPARWRPCRILRAACRTRSG